MIVADVLYQIRERIRGFERRKLAEITTIAEQTCFVSN
jgi:hypothetical protein